MPKPTFRVAPSKAPLAIAAIDIPSTATRLAAIGAATMTPTTT